MCACVCTHKLVYKWRCSHRPEDPLELELHMVVSLLMEVPGTELMSSGRATSLP